MNCCSLIFNHENTQDLQMTSIQVNILYSSRFCAFPERILDPGLVHSAEITCCALNVLDDLALTVQRGVHRYEQF